jgi:hypothetical protein
LTAHLQACFGLAPLAMKSTKSCLVSVLAVWLTAQDGRCHRLFLALHAAGPVQLPKAALQVFICPECNALWTSYALYVHAYNSEFQQQHILPSWYSNYPRHDKKKFLGTMIAMIAVQHKTTKVVCITLEKRAPQYEKRNRIVYRIFSEGVRRPTSSQGRMSTDTDLLVMVPTSATARGTFVDPDRGVRLQYILYNQRPPEPATQGPSQVLELLKRTVTVIHRAWPE